MSKFSLKRRFLLTRLPLVLAGVSAGTSCFRPTTTPQQTLSLVVDTIIPKDDHPGALDLNLDTRLLEAISNNSDKHALLLNFAARLNSQVQTESSTLFVNQTPSQRELTLTTILENGVLTDKQALTRIRSYILAWYYRSDAGHKSLGYTPPNQYRVPAK